MIFAPELAKKIAAGVKTQTRRPTKGQRECTYRPGRAYGVQSGRGKRATFRITILEVRAEKLGEIRLLDARKEGFRTTTEFADYWKTLYGSFDPVLDVWVLTFAKGDLTDRPRLLRASSPQAPNCPACGRAFADRDYLTGAPITICVCGARRPPESEDDHGYTSRRSSAMRGEGEAIPVKLQERYSEKAAEESAAKRVQQRKRLAEAVGSLRTEAAKIPRRELDPKTRKALRQAEYNLQTAEQALGEPVIEAA